MLTSEGLKGPKRAEMLTNKTAAEEEGFEPSKPR
jgi:hypothetical protein